MTAIRFVVKREDGTWLAVGVDYNVVSMASTPLELPYEMGRMLATYRELGQRPGEGIRKESDHLDWCAQWARGAQLAGWDAHGWEHIEMEARMVDSLDILRDDIDESLVKREGDLWDMHSEMLTVLLADGVCFTTTYNDVTKEHDNGTYITLLCSDTFAYSTADGETIGNRDIEAVYAASRTLWGATRWVALRRQCRPLPRVEQRMRDAGAWDEAMDALPPRV